MENMHTDVCLYKRVQGFIQMSVIFFQRIRCHLEECDNNSTLPKHEVYDEYK